jgi:DNA repair exonuclease SbcCD ATPase subunit
MIIFEKCRWKNFLSTGNSFTEIFLTKSPNTLVIGQNGAGKSTILDAMTFGLFGKPFRKINKPQLLNSINNGNCVVEIEFKIGKKSYKVIRGIKPNIFEIYCEGSLVNQDAKSKDYQEHLEINILKLNFKSFTQVVILGSASFVPFMQLSPADRRAIIEDLLDIQIFSSMNTMVKNKLSSIKDDQKIIEYEMKLSAERIKLQKQNLEERKKTSKDLLEKKQSELETNNSFIEKTNSDILLIQKHIDVLMSNVKEKETLENKNKKLFQIEAKIENNNKKLKKEIEFYENNDNCPTCQQVIEHDHKQKHITEKTQKLIEIDEASRKLEEEIIRINNKMEEINQVQKNINNHQSEIIKLNTQVSQTTKYNLSLIEEINYLSKTTNDLEVDNDKLKELKKELEKLVEDAKKLSEEKQYYEFAYTLLKDTGIKTKIIKQYIPVMNKLINKYLSAMDFFVNFNLNENFEETIKSRHRDVFSYASFSEGEKMRIDLALLFTWRQIAKMKNSVNTNLLILDEVFDSSLDSVGTEEFLKILNTLDNKTNVFVISHKGDQLFDKFRSIIRFVKKNNFSQVEK